MVNSSFGNVRTQAVPNNSERELRERALQLPWFHQIDLGQRVLTPGLSPIGMLKAQADIYFRFGVRGKSFLDIGCWDGFNSFEASRRGARDVLATDHFAWSSQCFGKRESFEIARSLLAPEVRVEEIDIPDLSVERVGQFDIVLFAGVFYHLRHPFLVLEQISTLVIETLIIETHLDALENERPAMIFYPGRELCNDATNWWGPNVACVTAMLKDVGFSKVEFTKHSHSDSRGVFHAKR